MAENQENFQNSAPDKGEVEMAQRENQQRSKTNEIFSQLTGEQKNTSKVSLLSTIALAHYHPTLFKTELF